MSYDAYLMKRIAQQSYNNNVLPKQTTAINMPPGTPRKNVINDFLSPNPSPIVSRLVREFVCTYFWLLFGYLIESNPNTDYVWSTAIGFALPLYVILEAYYGTAANPLLSIINWAFNQNEKPWYYFAAVVAQFAGAMTAAWQANALTPNFHVVVVTPMLGITDIQLVALEFIASFGFTWLYHIVYRTSHEGGVAIVPTKFRSLVIASYWFIATASCSASMHMFRNIAASIITGVYSKLLLYIIAQTIGYIIAASLFVLQYGQRRV